MEKLEALLATAQPTIHVADHVLGAGEMLYRALCEAGPKGIFSNTVNGRYSGRRSKAWAKVKCTRREEFVFIGWTTSSAKGRPFASLLLAQHEGGELVYKGNVETHFSAEVFGHLLPFGGCGRKGGVFGRYNYRKRNRSPNAGRPAREPSRLPAA